ncbi:MAG TPA: DinB family protein [Methylomirabilota bacterium]|nr:DinB family protein [Methylomirabilota bacterium]
MEAVIIEQTKQKARDYLRSRGTEVAASVVHERVAAALKAYEEFVASVDAATAARCIIPGEWTIQENVDHLVETYRPGVDELRCLLAGERPPGHPIPADLRSKAPRLRPWGWLLDELRRLHADALGLLASVPGDFATMARAPLVMVVNVPLPSGGSEPVHWVEELDWKAYAIVSWRLHAIDHLNQAKKVLAAR